MAPSAFVNQNLQNAPFSDQFWKFRGFRCSKMARRCGAKHISKSKYAKYHTLGPILEVQIFKKWHAAVARSTFSSQNAQNTCLRDQFLNARYSKMGRRCGAKHIFKSKCAKHHTLGPLFEDQMFKKARRCGAKHISKSEYAKHHTLRPLFENQIFKNSTPLWRQAHL